MGFLNRFLVKWLKYTNHITLRLGHAILNKSEMDFSSCTSLKGHIIKYSIQISHVLALSIPGFTLVTRVQLLVEKRNTSLVVFKANK